MFQDYPTILIMIGYPRVSFDLPLDLSLPEVIRSFNFFNLISQSSFYVFTVDCTIQREERKRSRCKNSTKNKEKQRSKMGRKKNNACFKEEKPFDLKEWQVKMVLECDGTDKRQS